MVAAVLLYGLRLWWWYDIPQPVCPQRETSYYHARRWSPAARAACPRPLAATDSSSLKPGAGPAVLLLLLPPPAAVIRGVEMIHKAWRSNAWLLNLKGQDKFMTFIWTQHDHRQWASIALTPMSDVSYRQHRHLQLPVSASSLSDVLRDCTRYFHFSHLIKERYIYECKFVCML